MCSLHRSKRARGLPICGFVGAFALLLVPGAMASSCSAETVNVSVPVATYVPAGCGDAGGAVVTFTGLGDFPQASPASEAVSLGSNGVTLTALPPATREVVITPLTDAGAWAGAALVPDAGPVNILTLPLNRACPLSTPVKLGDEPGAALGMVDGSHALVVGGKLPPTLVDLGVGTITPFGTSLGIDYATITPFGAGALIAGGETLSNDEALPSATLYTPGAGGGSLSGTTLTLPSGERMKHAAAVLPNGSVLLVGGVNTGGDLVTPIDVLYPGNPTANRQAPNGLRYGRIAPTVLALPNGQVFIGGGVDRSNNPVASVEWLAADLTPLAVLPLCGASVNQGFAPTEGGAVLAVMGSAPASCSNVTLLRSSGSEEAPQLTPVPQLVRLFAGAQASPVLVTDTGVLRWNPWTATFTPLGASTAATNLPTTAFVSATTGLAVWLGQDDDVWTLRFDTHGEYATDVGHGPYLVTDDLYTAPDRIAGADASVSFAPQSGATLANGATVWLTDATFAGLTASVTLPTGGPVILVLRDPSGNEVTCGATGLPAGATVSLARSGSSVTLTVGDGGAPSACSGAIDASARVAVGIRAPANDGGTTVVRGLAVTR